MTGGTRKELMLSHLIRNLGVAFTAPALIAMLLFQFVPLAAAQGNAQPDAPTGDASSLEADKSPGGCSAKDAIGKDDVLRPGRALCNGNYLVRMQTNGDLVLREISTGRACWHSNTHVPGVSTTFQPGQFAAPRFPVLKIGEYKIYGSNTKLNYGTTASLNSKGEFWIGYKKQAWCR
jgi:hypothetical protein